MKSIIQKDKECYLCGSTRNLELHHIMFGSHRPKSTKFGLLVWLCAFHHRDNRHGVHGNRELDVWFKQLAQNCFEIIYGHEMWMEVFGRNYLGEDGNE